MNQENNVAIPVIIGVVGGSKELSSVQCVFDEFKKTFGDSTPVKVMQADASGSIKLFDADTPQSHTDLLVARSATRSIVQDEATYLLRNSQFVVLAASLDKSHPIYLAIQENACEFSSDIPTVEGEDISAFELPTPAPVLVQTEPNSLKFEILNREKPTFSAHAHGKQIEHFSLGCWCAFKTTQPCALNFTQAL